MKASAREMRIWDDLCARRVALELDTVAANSSSEGIVSSSEHMSSGNICAMVRRKLTISLRLFCAIWLAPLMPRKYRLSITLLCRKTQHSRAV